MFVHAAEWLLHISSIINHQSRICVAGLLGSTNMTEIYVYVVEGSLLNGILKLVISNNSSSQADLTSGLV